MDFSFDGILFAAVNIVGDGGTGSGYLAVIDPATGVATVIGPFGERSVDELCSVEGIAFDPSGTLWSSHITLGPTGLPGIYTIDPISGEATFVASIDDGSGAPSGGVVSL